MASVKEKVQFVLKFHDTRSAITLQRNFKNIGETPLWMLNKSKSDTTNLNTSRVGDCKRTSRPNSSDDTIEAVRNTFQRDLPYRKRFLLNMH